MKKIFNTAFLIFLFAGCVYPVSINAAEKIKTQPLKIFLKNNCTVDLKKSSVQIGDIRSNSIGDALIESFLPYEKKFSLLSSICEFELPEKLEYTKDIPVEIVMQNKKTEYRPRLFLWDEEKKKWVQQETLMNRQTNTVSSDIHTAKGIIGVFADTNDAYEGIGSWYAHKRYPNGSATNLFPLGTKLRVTNLENKKQIDVAVTSTWTNKNEKRILDLVSTAFKKIAPLSKGLIRIRIEKITNAS